MCAVPSFFHAEDSLTANHRCVPCLAVGFLFNTVVGAAIETPELLTFNVPDELQQEG